MFQQPTGSSPRPTTHLPRTTATAVFLVTLARSYYSPTPLYSYSLYSVVPKNENAM